MPIDRSDPADSLIRVIAFYQQGVDRTLIPQNLRRSVEERVRNLVALQVLFFEARRAGGHQKESK